MITKYNITKLDCHSCAMVIEGICEDTPGVNKAEVNATKKVLTVEHEQSIQAEELKQTLGQQGYPVEIA